MGGPDTFRGCSFQAAYAVGVALDVLEGAGDAVILEGAEDVVDIAIEDAGGEPCLVIQAKTKIEPYVWAPGELSSILVQWLEARASENSRFEFVTDGSFGPAIVRKLSPALERLADQTTTKTDVIYLAGLGLSADEPALSRVSLRSRQPDGRTLLERATLRVAGLRERVAPISVEEAGTCQVG
jgi:hypothetical protein